MQKIAKKFIEVMKECSHVAKKSKKGKPNRLTLSALFNFVFFSFGLVH